MSNKENNKRKLTNDASAYWGASIKPQISSTNSPEVAERLFVALWEQCGKDVAIKALKPPPNKKPAAKKSKSTCTKSPKINGTWKLDAENTLKIAIPSDVTKRGRDDCTWIRGGEEPVELELTSTGNAGKLVFEGEAYEHNNCQDDFRVKLSVVYQEEGDLACGELECTQKCSRDYGPNFDTFIQLASERI